MNKITFKPSNAHDGHYVYLNGESTGIVVNYHAYTNPNCADYKRYVDEKIKKLVSKKL